MSRRTEGWGRRLGAYATAAALVLGLVAAAGCASAVVWQNGVFRSSKHGYTIAAPPGAWRRVSVDGTVLAFRRDSGTWMALSVRCGRPAAPPRILARELWIGLPAHHLLSSGEVQVDGRRAWSQVFETGSSGRRGSAGPSVYVKTITMFARGCVYDWVLVARSRSAAAESDFDPWWRSFRFSGSAAKTNAGASGPSGGERTP